MSDKKVLKGRARRNAKRKISAEKSLESNLRKVIELNKSTPTRAA